MGIQYASRSKVVAYTVVVVFAGVIASIAILLAGWLRVLLRLADQSYMVASLALTHLVYISES